MEENEIEKEIFFLKFLNLNFNEGSRKDWEIENNN